ncbi:alpha/beta hydrolase [Lactobacillus sp.]|uniref:alpha/beta hydrolase n=1 Tax=Lactobacillus sp. TaxID=1591 RepID=UPI003EF34951
MKNLHQETDQKDAKNKTRKGKKRLVITLIAILLVLLAAGGYWQSRQYQAAPAAKEAAKVAQVSSQATTFKSRGKSKLTVVFYPGAMVAPDAYSLWAKDLAQVGYTVKIAHFPLNLAITKPKAADSLTSQKEKFVIGGHSLGGAMAARYASQSKKKNLKGIFFLAAYADQKGRLDDKSFPALSITGSNDGVLNWNKYRANQQYLPKNTSFVTIKGGNHAGFGDYGAQRGDKKAAISVKKQQQIIAQTLIKWLNKVA